MKRRVPALALLVLVVITFVSMRAGRDAAEGRGYASKETVEEDGHVVLERFLDEKGRPVMLASGYAEIRREYEDGRNTVIRYLDTKGEPAVITSGYDTIRRTYTDGRADTDTYFREGVQTEHKQGYWQYQRRYTDGRASELRYLDRDGHPVNNKSGYAVIRRSYTEDGTIDMYFGADGEPVAAQLGQYGRILEKRDSGSAGSGQSGNAGQSGYTGGSGQYGYTGGSGRTGATGRTGDAGSSGSGGETVEITTYLGKDGEPENTNRGYAIVEKRGTKTLYYDKDGNPVTIGQYQYGTERAGGKIVFLDADGEPMLRLDTFLHTHPGIVLAAGVVLTLLTVRLTGRGKTALLVLYVLFIGLMTLWYREPGESRGALSLFDSYRQFFTSATMRQHILNNIWLFVPLGAALYRPGHPYRWLWGAALSVMVEVVQWKTGTGFCELDDMFGNSLGTFIGYGFAAWAAGQGLTGAHIRKEKYNDNGKML